MVVILAFLLIIWFGRQGVELGRRRKGRVISNILYCFLSTGQVVNSSNFPPEKVPPSLETHPTPQTEGISCFVLRELDMERGACPKPLLDLCDLLTND